MVVSRSSLAPCSLETCVLATLQRGITLGFSALDVDSSRDETKFVPRLHRTFVLYFTIGFNQRNKATRFLWERIIGINYLASIFSFVHRFSVSLTAISCRSTIGSYISLSTSSYSRFPFQDLYVDLIRISQQQEHRHVQSEILFMYEFYVSNRLEFSY